MVSIPDLDNLEFSYEFPETQGFSCDPEKNTCSNCCGHHQQFAILPHEINRINKFLETWLSSKEFESFVFDSSTCYGENIICASNSSIEYTFKRFRTELQTFFRPLALHRSNDTEPFIVLAHRIAQHPQTRKCIFLNPLTLKCEIYHIRPFECQIYPFNFKCDLTKDNKIKIFVNEVCRGLMGNTPVNKPSIESKIKNYLKLTYEDAFVLKELEVKTKVPLIIWPVGQRGTGDSVKKIDIFASKNNLDSRQIGYKIKDILLDEKIINCLNEVSYRDCLSGLELKMFVNYFQ